MSIIRLFILTLCIFSTSAFSQGIEKIFYTTPDNSDGSFSSAQLKSLVQHAKDIDIIAPQVYIMDEHGEISGGIDPELINIANKQQTQVMPLIVNHDFNQEKFHGFLQSKAQQIHAIDSMLDLCKQHNYIGIQFDFESINVDDKDKFSDFFKLAAQEFHKRGLLISTVVVPRTSDEIQDPYDRWYYDNWAGAYDYKALGKYCDFISVMAYDQHTGLTTPGPIAAYDWVEDVVTYILKDVAANKISLGLPTYSGYWLSGSKAVKDIPEKYTFRALRKTIGYTKVQDIVNQNNLTPQWNEQWKLYFAAFSVKGKNQYLFIEDAKSYQAKSELVKKYNLRGISVWKFGLEDPNIW